MAEAILRDRVAKARLADQIKVDSAGVGRWHVGEPAHSSTLAILRRNNIPHNGHARQILADDLATFDYVLPVDRMTYNDLRRLDPPKRGELSLFLKWAKESGLTETDEVPDPYYDGSFDRTYELVTRGCDALLAHIREAHKV
jgi:protein-tyrosine phosphatase